MLLPLAKCTLTLPLAIATAALSRPQQVPLRSPLESTATKNITVELFNDLEESSRIVDIAYCVGTAGLGIQKPFLCASRCQDFPNFELQQTWNTGPLLPDSCGYIALSHPPSVPRVIVAFRGTYSIANAIIDLSTIPQDYVPYPDEDGNQQNEDDTKCHKCMVHAGFLTSWRHTRTQIVRTLEHLIDQHPNYRLTLVGHSLGGAVAALASLDFHAKGWAPQVTTFGEPRVGNRALTEYIDEVFHDQSRGNASDRYRRVTHVDDLVPLLPLSEWGYSSHGQEIYISKPDLPPENVDLRLCEGNSDPQCVAGAETTVTGSVARLGRGADVERFRRWWLKSKGVLDIPARFRLWQWFFAHRDYFWRLGLCIPGGDPKHWYRTCAATVSPAGR